MSKSTASTVTDQSSKVADLQGFISKQRDGRQLKKALAVKLLYQGHTYESVVSILDVSMGSVAGWKQAYEASGLLGLMPQHKGRKGYLEAAERAAVLDWLKQKSIWTLGELEYHLAEGYDVTYESKQSYYDLFEAAGLSWKKTSKANPKADAKAVAVKKQTSSGFWHATRQRLSKES